MKTTIARTIPFVAGRIFHGSRQLVILRPDGAEFPGPWDLRAVILA